jgi:hypothetical protein
MGAMLGVGVGGMSEEEKKLYRERYDRCKRGFKPFFIA